MKSLSRRVREAAELLTVAGIVRSELLSLTVYRSRVHVLIEPEALAWVYVLFRVRRSAVEASVSQEGNFHISFAARGATWACVVLGDSPQAGRWRERLAEQASRRLSGRAQLCLPTVQEVERGDDF